MPSKKTGSGGATRTNGKGKRRASALEMSERDVQRLVEEERAAMLRARQTELDQVVDAHDNLVREAFHLNHFRTMVTFDPKTAKEDNSAVYQEFKAQYDLLEHSITSSSGPSRRTTRRAHNERVELLKGSTSSTSAPAPPVAGPSTVSRTRHDSEPGNNAVWDILLAQNRGATPSKPSHHKGRSVSVVDNIRAQDNPTESASAPIAAHTQKSHAKRRVFVELPASSAERATSGSRSESSSTQRTLRKSTTEYSAMAPPPPLPSRSSCTIDNRGAASPPRKRRRTEPSLSLSSASTPTNKAAVAVAASPVQTPATTSIYNSASASIIPSATTKRRSGRFAHPVSNAMDQTPLSDLNSTTVSTPINQITNRLPNTSTSTSAKAKGKQKAIFHELSTATLPDIPTPARAPPSPTHPSTPLVTNANHANKSTNANVSTNTRSNARALASTPSTSIRRIKLIVRKPPPSFTSPAQKPILNPPFGGSVEKLLESYTAPSFGVPSRAGSGSGAGSGSAPSPGLGTGAGAAGRMWKNELKDMEEDELQELAMKKARIWERICEARRDGMLSFDLDSMRRSPSTAVGGNGSRSASRSGSVAVGEAGSGAGVTAEDVEGRGKEPRDIWDFVTRDVKAAYKRRLADSAAARAFNGHGGSFSIGMTASGVGQGSGAAALMKAGYGGVGPFVAGMVAGKVRMHWEAVAAKEEKKRAELEREWRARWKVGLRELINEWKKAVLYIRKEEQEKWEAEEARRGKEHLDAILDQSGLILETQHAELSRAAGRSRSSSVSATLRDWEDEDDEEDEDEEEEVSGEDVEEDEGGEEDGDGDDRETEEGGEAEEASQGPDGDEETSAVHVSTRNLVGYGEDLDQSRSDPPTPNSSRSTPTVDPSRSGSWFVERHSLAEFDDSINGPSPSSDLVATPSTVTSPFATAPENSYDGPSSRKSLASGALQSLEHMDIDTAYHGQALFRSEDGGVVHRVVADAVTIKNPPHTTEVFHETVARVAHRPTEDTLVEDEPRIINDDSKNAPPVLEQDIGMESDVPPITDAPQVSSPTLMSPSIKELVEKGSAQILHEPLANLNVDMTPSASVLNGDAAGHGESQENEPSDDDDEEEGHKSIPSYLRPYAVTPVDWDPTNRVTAPLLLRGHLRPYQQAGLEWLANHHLNNMNGILADEMGLGKTIQTIALLAHLACDRGIWGPHLIVVPTSVLLNWEMEFKKFLPGFNVLAYHGTTKRRKELRQGWNDKSHFNVCITSYTLASRDAHIFKRKPWYYMILDEAHMIKNFRSQRWNTLLMFRSWRRLLLTGTPLQNNLSELWALLQFLMSGSNFANLKEFGEWFSNPLEKAIESGTVMDDDTQQRVSKLHTVLRPYLLRRLKKDVEKELPRKYEHLVLCPLSKRQRFLYDEFMSRAQTRNDLGSGVYQKIANVLMQLRKVCNHPDLFEVRPIRTSFPMTASAVADFEIKELLVRRRLLQDESEFGDINLDLLGLRFIDRQNTSRVASTETMRLQETDHLPFIYELPGKEPPYDTRTIRGFKIHRQYQHRAAMIARWSHFAYLNRLRCNSRPIYSRETLTLVERCTRRLLPSSALDRSKNYLEIAEPIHSAIKSYEDRAAEMAPLVDKFACITPAVVAPDVRFHALPAASPVLYGTLNQDTKFDAILHQPSVKLQIAFPDPSLLQYDCGKLQELTRLLRERKAGGHRCLIFTQMTRILDILESFLNHHGYLYLRLDGATKIEDRQYITERFNSDPRIFCFIASSRSGGVGINLTGADTVIFYDSDFNPQMDRQCEDRAHRIGQIRDVHIFRFISQHTVEEAMLRKANQKRSLDDLVIQKGQFDWRSLFGQVEQVMEGEGFTRALEDFADQEDVYAAKVAAEEAGELEGADQADFGEDSQSVGAPRKVSMEDMLPVTAVEPVKESEHDGPDTEEVVMIDEADGEEQEPGATADYMVAYVRYEYDFFKEWRL